MNTFHPGDTVRRSTDPALHSSRFMQPGQEYTVLSQERSTVRLKGEPTLGTGYDAEYFELVRKAPSRALQDQLTADGWVKGLTPDGIESEQLRYRASDDDNWDLYYRPAPIKLPTGDGTHISVAWKPEAARSGLGRYTYSAATKRWWPLASDDWHLDAWFADKITGFTVIAATVEGGGS